jgi:hypothetical protein
VKNPHRLVLIAAAVLCCTAIPALCQEISVAGHTATVVTKRYLVRFDGLAVTRIENLLTGEVYASEAQSGEPSTAMAKMLPKTGVAIESLRPAVPVKYYTISDRTSVSTTKASSGASIVYTGLQYGQGKDAEFDPKLVMTLSLKVDGKTGDLLITPSVKGNIEKIHDVRDRGVLRSSIQLHNLDGDLKVIIPYCDGSAFTKENTPKDWIEKDPAAFPWPMRWQAALFIAESPKGCLGIWADEPKLNYGRHLSLSRNQNSWLAGFEFETADMIYRCDEIKGATWRLNVYDGYWMKAAKRYRDQMAAQWPEYKPLKDRTPEWASKIRLVTTMVPSPESASQIAELVPRDSVGCFTSQGWLKGWNTGEMHRDGRTEWFPNAPLENPDHFEGADGFKENAKAVEDLGFHVFPYTNSWSVAANHPWIRDKIGDRHYGTWRIWQRLYSEMCLDITKRYPVTAIYEDCSWVCSRNVWGEPDGDNWYNGTVNMHRYFHEIMPEIGLMGERNHEVSARNMHLALSITMFPQAAHPINSYLFDPYIRVWNLMMPGQAPGPVGPVGLDADDIRGFISTWAPHTKAHPIQEDLMVRLRGIVFASDQLESIWPEKWNPNVLHYYRGKSGAEYRFVRDRGTRFVKMTGDRTETIYWRTSGVTELDAPGSAIEGWLGYDGDKIIGLNPKAAYVVVSEADAPRSPAVVNAIPAGFGIACNVVRDGYWTVRLDTLERLAKPLPAPDAPVEQVEQQLHAVRVRCDRPVTFLGVESTRLVSAGEYEVMVKLPGSFSAYWTEPTAVQSGDSLVKYPAVNSWQRPSSGVVYGTNEVALNVARVAQQNGDTSLGDEGTIDWLVTLPKEPVALSFRYGGEHAYGDGGNYMVRVNGKTLWKKYRAEVPTDPKDQETHKPIPATPDRVDLSAYAGQTIVIELAANGHYSGGSNVIAWSDPRLVPAGQ